MKILVGPEWVERYEYRLSYELEDASAGFNFPCDETGKVDTAHLYPDALENYRTCQTGHVGDKKLKEPILLRYDMGYKMPAIGLCTCGEELELIGFTNTCEGCGSDYNSSGQRLAPREQWGEDTGESLSEILQIK